MRVFRQLLSTLHPTSPPPQRWLYVPYDQLHLRLSPLDADDASSQWGLVLVESLERGRRRPVHKQKLALLLSNQRHFALEAAKAGFHVTYLAGAAPISEQLRAFAAEASTSLTLREAAERDLRAELQPLIDDDVLQVGRHRGWLTSRETFLQSQGKRKQWRMDAFYKKVRQQTGLLMDGDQPEGGAYSHDVENRLPYKAKARQAAPLPTVPTFAVDEVTQEVIALVEEAFADHPGVITPTSLPVTLDDAKRSWAWALQECLPHFGPYEDAMTTSSHSLFHTLVSPLLNLHRLLPRDVVQDVSDADHLPLPSREGFIRQVIGWREFVKHIHDVTDGFRRLPDGTTPAVLDMPAAPSWPHQAAPLPDGIDGGACPSALEAEAPLPAAFWGTPSGLACLDDVTSKVMQTGYAHHIERLMVLGNIATLLDVRPRALTDWFWAGFIDAYDWVVEPNVLAMATYGTGPVMTTKPYVCSANYLHKMSDACSSCAFHPKKNCPITQMYWAFLDDKRPQLEKNVRLAMPYRNLARRSDAQKAHDHAVADWVKQTLANGEVLDVSALPVLNE